ncbi:CoA ester lyase [Sorangium sp. So ce429]
MQFTKFCRSVLFVTALRPDRYVKCQEAGADISLVDLEDSVSGNDKHVARKEAERFFTAKASGSGLRAMRINAISHQEGLRDLLAILDYAAKPDMIAIPKVESPRDVEIAELVLRDQCRETGYLAIVETARGIENVFDIARSSSRLRALVFGSADYSFSIGSSMSDGVLYHARSRIVTAARAAGIHAIDTACFDIRNTARLDAEARMCREMGFSGKAAIHPSQLRWINAAFSPDDETLEKARRIVAASRESNQNVCVVDGMMVGIPIVDAARRILSEFDGGGRGEAPLREGPRESDG